MLATPQPGDRLEDLNVTREELDRFGEAMRSAEFRKLFAEYAEEISNPENKKAYEEELAKLEAEKGNAVRFVKPTPGFVVKTAFTVPPTDCKTPGISKVFINICTSEEIAKATSKIGMKKESKGQQWSVPYSLAPGREDVDNSEKPCMVYDCTLNPETYEMSLHNAKFKEMIVSIAIEGVERQFGVKLERKFKIPKLKYKGVPTSTIIRENDPNLKPTSNTTTDFLSKLAKTPLAASAPAPTPKPSTTPATTTNRQEEQRKLIQELSDEPVSSSSSATMKPTPRVVEPKYKIIHRGVMDMSNYTNDRENRSGARPDQLVVKIELPLVPTASQVDLDITPTHLDLTVPSKYKLSLSLPFPVNEDSGTAQFDKSKRVLTVTMDVTKPVVEKNGDVGGNSLVEEMEKMEVTKDDDEEVEKMEEDVKEVMKESENVTQQPEQPSTLTISSTAHPADFSLQQTDETATMIIAIPNISQPTIQSVFEPSGMKLVFCDIDSNEYFVEMKVGDQSVGLDVEKCKVFEVVTKETMIVLLRKVGSGKWASVLVMNAEREFVEKVLEDPNAKMESKKNSNEKKEEVVVDAELVPVVELSNNLMYEIDD